MSTVIGNELQLKNSASVMMDPQVTRKQQLSAMAANLTQKNFSKNEWHQRDYGRKLNNSQSIENQRNRI